MKKPSSLVVLALSLMIVPPGCAHSERPVLYPNNHLKQVGNDQAQAEIDECMRLAQEYGADSSSGGNFPNIAQSLHRGPDHQELIRGATTPWRGLADEITRSRGVRRVDRKVSASC